MDLGRRPQKSRSNSNQSLNLLGPTEDEVRLRKRLLAEEYKRALVAQIEERRQMRKQEKARLDEERKLEQNFHKNASAKRQKVTQHVTQVCPRKSEVPQTTMTASQHFRRIPVSRTDPRQAEVLQKKYLREEEYKRELVAPTEEQRLRREQEKATRLEEEKKMIWEQQNKQEVLRAKRQEVLDTERREEPQSSSGAALKHRYVCHAPWDPVKTETAMEKRLKEEEYKRELQAQIEEKRQRREKEKEAERVEEQAQEEAEKRRQKWQKESKQWRFPQDTLGRRWEVTVDTPATTEFSQSSKYAHNLSCLLDPAQLELMERKRIKDEEHRRELQAQIEEKRQRREKEKEAERAEEQAQEEAEKRRQKWQKESKQWRFPQDTLGRRWEVTVDIPATMEFSQSSKYAHKPSCLLDPAQLELMERKRIKDEEHRRELDKQVADQRQRRAKEKEELLAKELAQERAEEMRLKREEEVRQQKLQLEQKKSLQEKQTELETDF